MKNNSLIYGIVAVVLVIAGIIVYANKKPSVAPKRNEEKMEERNEDKREDREDNEDNEKDDESRKMEASGSTKSVSVTVEGGKFWFKPAEITVKKGEKVTLTFKNTEGMHNWIVDEFDAKTKTIQTGESDTIIFTPDKTGTFEFYCGIGNHRQMGMKGNLIVK